MASLTLTAERPLAGYDRDFGMVRVTALDDLALVSVALPMGGEAAAQKAIKAGFGAELPAPGRYATGKGGERLIRTGADQGLIQFIHADTGAGADTAGKLGGKVYLTDQSDAWVGLAVQGPGARTALERMCPLDLHPDVFGTDNAQRTVMEHLGVVILRVGTDAFLLMSASSSALSFLHAVETSAENTA